MKCSPDKIYICFVKNIEFHMGRCIVRQIHFIKISKISTIDRKLKTSIVYNCTAPKYRHNKHCSNLAAN